MIDLGKGIEIVVETSEVSLEKLEESEFFLENTTELVMTSCEEMVVVGDGSKRRMQLTVCENCHRKYVNLLLHTDHEKQCGKPGNLWVFLPSVIFCGSPTSTFDSYN